MEPVAAGDAVVVMGVIDVDAASTNKHRKKQQTAWRTRAVSPWHCVLCWCGTACIEAKCVYTTSACSF